MTQTKRKRDVQGSRNYAEIRKLKKYISINSLRAKRRYCIHGTKKENAIKTIKCNIQKTKKKKVLIKSMIAR